MNHEEKTRRSKEIAELMAAKDRFEEEALKQDIDLKVAAQTNRIWDRYDERQKRLISNCRAYAKSDPAGLPGHNLMLIIAEMSSHIEELAGVLRRS